MRIDQLIVERGLAASRAQAQRLIAGGARWRLGAGAWKTIAKNGDEVPDGAELELLDAAEARYVSRGGLKLEGALAATGLDVTDKRCLDVGQSTGGFTDCLLQRGAAQVIGVDVGHGQLHERLRSHPRVVCVEGVNARSLRAQVLQEASAAALSEPAAEPAVQEEAQPQNPYRWMSGSGEVTDYDDSDDVDDAYLDAEKAKATAPTGEPESAPEQGGPADGAEADAPMVFDVVTGDLSFISLTLVLPALVPLLAPQGALLMLVKPQFELQPGQVGKGGIVRDAALYAVVEQRIRDCCAEQGLQVQAWLDSPISGGDGNREFFVFARRGG